MPRQPRLDLANIRQHVVQRDNDRQPCFFTDVDRVRYLQDLREISQNEGCSVHAYVLMTNHVHLLMTPTASGQVSRVMQSLGRRYVRYINDRYRRTGTLWEGRCKSSLVDRETYLLHCYRYIELNPVRARTTLDPLDYLWSSHAQNAFGKDDPLIHPHPDYLALGSTDQERHSAYRALAMENLSQDHLEAIRTYLQRQHALGSDRFCIAIEKQLSRRTGPAKIGRPRKATQDQTPKSAL
ncbi:MAG: transposase [Bryocella sp.]